jgi:DNA-binding LytR/AlgR family response regulator
MILNCLIVDDEPIARKILQEYIEETDFLRLVGTAENPLKIISLIDDKEVDLIYLDINMPKMNGLEFLRSASSLPMVIMTTAYGQYALEGFEMDVVDYLVKPFSLERFVKASQKALLLKNLIEKSKTAKGENKNHFYVKSNGKLNRINYDDLLYIEAMENYITLYTTSEKFIVYLTLKKILEDLSNMRFVQVNKSVIVNLDKVTSIEGNLICVGKIRIPIGQSFQNEVLGKILTGKYFKR